MQTSSTDGDGYYTLTIPSNSQAYIFASGDCIPDTKYTQLWYDGGNGSFNCYAASPVPDGGTANFKLSPAGFIEGFVYQQDGTTPVRGVCINVSSASPPDWNGVAGTCYTDDNGYYSIHTVPTGSVYVTTEVDTDQNSLSLVNEWYGGTTSTHDPSQALSVTVDANETTPTINFQLDSAGTITGTVFQMDGLTPFGEDISMTGPMGQMTAIRLPIFK